MFYALIGPNFFEVPNPFSFSEEPALRKLLSFLTSTVTTESNAALLQVTLMSGCCSAETPSLCSFHCFIPGFRPKDKTFFSEISPTESMAALHINVFGINPFLQDFLLKLNTSAAAASAGRKQLGKRVFNKKKQGTLNIIYLKSLLIHKHYRYSQKIAFFFIRLKVNDVITFIYISFIFYIHLQLCYYVNLIDL